MHGRRAAFPTVFVPTNGLRAPDWVRFDSISVTANSSWMPHFWNEDLLANYFRMVDCKPEAMVLSRLK